MDVTPGIDVSRWQGEIDWQAVAGAGFRFAMIRATVGDYYTDPRFYVNWNEAKEAGLLVSAYHVVVPKNTVYSQIDRLFEVLGDRKPDLPLVMDVERHDKVSKAQITSTVQGCLQKAEKHDGRRPVIYTAKWFWDNPNYIIPSDDWSQYDLWVANYVEDPATTRPVLPSSWDEWMFWQYSDKGTVSGVSAPCDLNWFAGTYADLRRYGGLDSGGGIEPDEGLRARVLVDSLNVRSGPGLEHEVVGRLERNDLITVFDAAGYEVWVEFEQGKWAAMYWKGDQFIDIE